MNKANHLDNVFTTRTNVLIVHAPEFRKNFFKLGLERPFSVAEFLADVAVERRWVALTYTGTMFLLVPIILIALLR